MSKVPTLKQKALGFDFVDDGDDDFRPWPFSTAADDWRELTAEEINILGEQGNRADDWANICVSGEFDARCIRDSVFYGPNRIASMQQAILEHNDLRLPVGIHSSCIIACDIGSNTAIHNVSYLAHMRIQEQCILFNIQEMISTNHAKFGNGVIKDGESEDVRIWLEIANENGGRRVLPFDGMLPSDAWIWSKYRADKDLMKRFVDMTSLLMDSKRGSYGSVGRSTVIKDCRILKDLRIGASAYIKGANKLKNLTINSSPEEPTQIGEGCELVNGIIGYGCKVFYGVKAVRFILNDHSSLKYGARLINSILGPNSTISCCEVLNSLLYYAHEQHHNSSFLCASTFKGMSNMASAATVGSNHNSRAADGEILAERGFWPGLSVSLKHNSRFAAYCLIVKGSYPAELNIPLPFSLISNDVRKDELLIMPGYWFRYNMYALARSSAKTADRDMRKGPRQYLEYDWLAPDTIDQMMLARDYIENWAGGRRALESLPKRSKDILCLPQNHIEAGKRPVQLLHARRGWEDYGRMIRFYCVRTLLQSGGNEGLKQAIASIARNPGKVSSAYRPRQLELKDPWENIGGQLMRQSTLKKIIKEIKNKKIPDWPSVHEAYIKASDNYSNEKHRHAVEVLSLLIGSDDTVGNLIEEVLESGDFICESVKKSRKKDYDNPFRNIVYDSNEERDAVMGGFEENSFIAGLEKNWLQFRRLLECN